EKEEAAAYWKQKGKNINVSFPANLASVAAACVTERLAFGGSFLIEMAATDGGGFPRNGLIQKLLSFYRLGYLSLAEVVEKCSVNPAAAFGLTGKGHLGPGADADITLLDMERLEAVMSFAAGKRILDHEKVVGTGGTFLTTEIGMKKAREKGLCCRMVNTAGSSLYGKREERSGFSGKNTTGTLKG
ncbi:amidohydrolase family protein, partial [[Clostridium] symbiosum]